MGEEQGTSPEVSAGSGHNADIEIIVVQCQAGRGESQFV